MTEWVETIIIGAGQAGLAMSYHLARLGREHVILERSRVAERWRSERWDSLVFQFPNWTMRLPGHAYQSGDPDGFAPRHEVVRFIEQYAGLIKAPVRCGVRVVSLRQKPGAVRFVVQTDDAMMEASNVVVATGPFHEPAIPPFAATLPADVAQVPSSRYRNPAQLPPGGVLVVGCGASGCQIAEELYQSERKVYLSLGRYRRAPRRYRDRDIFWWLQALGILDRPADLYPEMKKWRVPLVTGVNGGHDIDLRRFAADGVTLLGRVRDFQDGRFILAPDVEQNLTSGDEWYVEFRKKADDYVREAGIDLPEEPPPGETPPAPREESHPVLTLDAKASGVRSVVWASGFRTDFGWVELPVFDEAGEPDQRRGVTRCPGLYFLGLRRMYTLGSAVLSGVGSDAAYIAEQIVVRGSTVPPRAA